MPTPQGDTLTVLVVDDDPAVRDSLEAVLGAAGYRCTLFASGAEFLASDPGTARGCVLVDVRMPGMDGLELQRQMKARAIALPVIFMTGFGEVPLDLKIRETSDGGTPITVVEPDNPYALVFRQMAARIWEKVAGETADRRTPPRIVIE